MHHHHPLSPPVFVSPALLFLLFPFFLLLPLSHKQYEVLERAITNGQRVAVTRRGIEYVVVPDGLRVVTGREVLDARHPATGEPMTLVLDDLGSVELVATR